jgi:hypothetical protein
MFCLILSFLGHWIKSSRNIYTKTAKKHKRATQNHLYFFDHSLGFPASSSWRDTTLDLRTSLSWPCEGLNNGCRSCGSPIMDDEGLRRLRKEEHSMHFCRMELAFTRSRHCLRTTNSHFDEHSSPLYDGIREKHTSGSRNNLSRLCRGEFGYTPFPRLGIKPLFQTQSHGRGADRNQDVNLRVQNEQVRHWMIASNILAVIV